MSRRAPLLVSSLLVACGDAGSLPEQAVVISAAGSVAMQAQALQIQAQAEPIYLYVDEHALNDAERAKLVELWATLVPVEEWPAVTVREGEGLESVVDRRYDFFAADREGRGLAYPRTTAVLVDQIMKNNPEAAQIHPGDTLAVPPIPVRPLDAEVQVAVGKIRAYDALTQRYSRPVDIEELGRTTIVPTEEVEYFSVAEVFDYRKAQFTVFAIDPSLKKAFLDLDLPESYILMRSDHMASIQLLDCENKQCGADEFHMRQSPYYELARERAASLDSTERRQLREQAESQPLTIIDWGIVSNLPDHGHRVLNVAHATLEMLGFDYLSDAIQTIDLDPQRNREGLLTILEQYEEYWEKADSSDASSFFQEAKDWIRTSRGVGDGCFYEVHVFVLRAVFWKVFRASKSAGVVNISLTIHGREFLPLLRKYLTHSKVLGVVAAGNDPVGMEPYAEPQGAASTNDHLFNVSYGDVDGRLKGARSNRDRGHYVQVVTYGCGFNRGSIQPQHSGSSYATPLIAATTWVRMLLDGEGPQSLRTAVIRASRPNLIVDEPIESGAWFDAAYLVAASALGPTLVLHNKQVVEGDSLWISADFSRGHDTQEVTLAHNPDGRTVVSVRAIRCFGNQVCFWWREIDLDELAEPEWRYHDWQVDRAELRFVVAGDSAIVVNGPAAMEADSLVFMFLTGG